MPDLPNRDELEARLANRLSRRNSKFRSLLLALLGSDPRLDLIPDSFYQEIADGLASVLIPFAANRFAESAAAMEALTTIGLGEGLVQSRAAEFARQYAFDLITGINARTRGGISDAFTAFFEGGQEAEILRDRISALFGPSRWERIASTELTRVHTQGELMYVEELRRQGVGVTEVWFTQQDERVCPICGPLHGQARNTNWSEPPPAHVNCRCQLDYRFESVERLFG